VAFFILSNMRIDKYLWCIRQFKTRSLASEMVKKERIHLNGELVKASREVKVGDRVAIKKDGVTYSLKVLGVPPSRVGAKLVEQYAKDTTPAEEIEKLEFIRMMRSMNRKKGSGRPTKKDRRDLDDFNLG